MRIGTEYEVKRVHRRDWLALARQSQVPTSTVLDPLVAVLEALPEIVDRIADTCISAGLDPSTIRLLRERTREPIVRCLEMMQAAKRDTDGSYTIQFGGCTRETPNCIVTPAGWNYMVRQFRPRKSILDGTWKFPEARPSR